MIYSKLGLVFFLAILGGRSYSDVMGPVQNSEINLILEIEDSRERVKALRLLCGRSFGEVNLELKHEFRDYLTALIGREVRPELVPLPAANILLALDARSETLERYFIAALGEGDGGLKYQVANLILRSRVKPSKDLALSLIIYAKSSKDLDEQSSIRSYLGSALADVAPNLSLDALLVCTAAFGRP